MAVFSSDGGRDMSEQQDEGRKSRQEEERERLVTNVVLFVIFLGLVGAGIWIADGMLDARRADECISAGRRNCLPIEVPPR
jgi:hypothetical protein